MGIGSNKSGASIIAGTVVAAQLFASVSAPAFERDSGIWRVLHVGHFGLPMNEGAHVLPIKSAIVMNGARYRFWEYSWEDRRTTHGGSALLVFGQTGSQLSYLGYYDFEPEDFHGPVHPEIRGNTVFFPYKDIEVMGVKMGKIIAFDEKGPPARVRLGEDYYEFRK